jgi:hypothetical protein
MDFVKTETCMQENELQNLKEWFGAYLAGFDDSPPDLMTNIRLKVEHTDRVCKNIVEIASSMPDIDIDLGIAEAIGLFHDLGRFEQIKQYGTFCDRSSIDHAMARSAILKETGVLDSLPPPASEIILKAIELHSRASIPPEITGRIRLYVMLIRDADKLDILKILSSYYEDRSSDRFSNRNSVLDFELKDEDSCSKKMIDAIMERRIGKMDDLQTINDMKLLHISWIFDINFRYTLERIQAEGLIGRIFRTLPDTDEMRELCRRCQKIVEDELIDL